jgi:hypothetical protein
VSGSDRKGSGQGPQGPVHDEVRRIIEEATRLVEAFGGLPAGHAGDECRICPVCRTLATLRELRPEVLDHLGAAATELLAAAREFAAAPGPGWDGGPARDADPERAGGPARAGGPVVAARPRTPRRPAVQHIEITD